MNALRISFDWENPEGVRGDELRATWARLSMSVDGNLITEVSNRLVRNVGESLYMPLYPFAEWLVERWWNLFYEPQTPGRRAGETYRERHNLMYADEGYVMPDLTVVPIGDTSVLNWKATRHPQSPVRFISEGMGVCRTNQVRDEFAALIDAVVGRLREEGLPGTYLETEWGAIQKADPSEREFCAATAALGLDPYGLDEEESQVILATAARLPSEGILEFFGAAEADLLLASARELEEATYRASLSPVDLQLGDLRDRARRLVAPEGLPWEVGYAVAHLARRELGTKFDLAQVVASGGQIERTSKQWLDGIARVEDPRHLAFSLPRIHLNPARFVAARALFEYLTAPEGKWRLLTRGRSSEQASNRSFAAEFLVPSEELRSLLSSDYVDQEEIEELAERFAVSHWVVRHQIENNRLATMSSD